MDSGVEKSFTKPLFFIINKCVCFTIPDTYASIFMYATKVFAVAFVLIYVSFSIMSKGIQQFNKRVAHLMY